MTYRIAIDIGGTFTDGVIENVATQEVRLAKRLTTQADPGQALADVVDDLLAAVRQFNGSGSPAGAVCSGSASTKKPSACRGCRKS